MDTVFRMYNNTIRREEYMLDNWGEMNLKMAFNWTNYLKNNLGDNYDRNNLHLSGIIIRNSINIKVTQQIASTAQLSSLSRPEMFVHIISQRTVMSDIHIRTMRNSLGNQSLGSISGEHVPKITTTKKG